MPDDPVTPAPEPAPASEPAAPEQTVLAATQEPEKPELDKTILDGLNKEETKEGEPAKEGEKEADAGPPEGDYEFTLPEGMELDTEAAEKYTPVFKDLGLSQDQAQKLVNLRTEELQGAANQQVEAWNKVRADWLDTAKSDEEIGGAKFNESLSYAGAAIREYGTPEFVKAMDELGVGNHPEFIRFISRVGKDSAEGSVRTGSGQAANTMQSALARMYPSLNKNK